MPSSLFQTAYLKAHYPTEFMAALLSSEMDGAEREKFFVEHIDDCRRMGIEVLPPDINEGEAEFRVAAEGKIHFGLGAIKGVGLKAVEAIVQGPRRGGAVHGPRRLLRAGPAERRSARRASRRSSRPARSTASGRGGASAWPSCPGPSQAGQARPGGPQARSAQPLRRLRGRRRRPSQRQRHAATTSSLPDVPELPDVERLAEEKKVLGFYMSSHPLTRHAGLLQALATHQVADLADRRRASRRSSWAG